MKGLWNYLIASESIALKLIIHVAFTIPVLLCAALLVNSMAADYSESQDVKVKVESVYRKTKYRTKRVSRRVYAKGAPYYVYGIDCRFPSGNLKSIEIPKKKYDYITKGDTVILPVCRGALGMPVIRASEIKTKTNVKPKRHRWPGPMQTPRHNTDNEISI